MARRRAKYESALLAVHSLAIHPVGSDGNCLFRAVADQVYGDESAHAVVRAAATDLMAIDADFFADFVAGSFPRYLARMRKLGTWGDDPEVQAMADVYSRNVEIFGYDPQAGARRLRAFKTARPPPRSAPPMRLSFFLGGHYDSLRSGSGSSDASAILLGPPGEAEAAFFVRVHAAIQRAEAAKAKRRARTAAKTKAAPPPRVSIKTPPVAKVRPAAKKSARKAPLRRR